MLRAERGVLICRTRHGFVCANAGVDASNAVGRTRTRTLIVLPRDPDASARRIRARLRELTGATPAVLITDSFGRAWRHGQCDVAIGCAGMPPLEDWRGRTDARRPGAARHLAGRRRRRRRHRRPGPRQGLARAGRADRRPAALRLRRGRSRRRRAAAARGGGSVSLIADRPALLATAGRGSGRGQLSCSARNGRATARPPRGSSWKGQWPLSGRIDHVVARRRTRAGARRTGRR